MVDELFTEKVEISTKCEDGQLLKAVFLPSKGMNLISYKKGNCEIIDQSTKYLFEQRYAGLGAMIGPHFHHRNPEAIPPLKNIKLFPHISRLKPQVDPFSHGIGRYAPWKLKLVSDQMVEAILTGDCVWNGVMLKELEGQNFRMEYKAQMVPQGLEINLHVSSDQKSIVGLHTYYALANGRGNIICQVQDHYVEKSEFKQIPSTWNFNQDHTLFYNLNKEIDFGFHPFPDALKGTIVLESETHSIKVQYISDNQENSFQLWHPLGESFVCIEPLSAKDPRKPKLSTSQLKILISIL